MKHLRRLPPLALVLALISCQTGVPPLGPDSVIFYGTTVDQNPHDELGVTGGSPMKVFVVMAETNDFPYTGSAADLTNYTNTKKADWEGNCDAYWLETSFGDSSVSMDWPAEVQAMKGAFLDYFNRPYVRTSLTTSGLAGGWPLALDGNESAVFEVKDAEGRIETVSVFPAAASYADAAALAAEFQTFFDAVTGVPSEWIECLATPGGEVRIRLEHNLVKEGTFIRVTAGIDRDELGLLGPLETTGNPGLIALQGKPAPGGYPLTLDGTESVTIEVRDKKFRTRRYTVALPAGVLADPGDLADELLPAINAEFNWVDKFDSGTGRLGLYIKTGFFSSPDKKAAVRVVGGMGLAKLGLDGPMRVDGVIHQTGTNTVRGSRPAIVAEALSLYIAKRFAASPFSVEEANKADLDSIVAAELGGYDSILVNFIEDTTGVPDRRAGAYGTSALNIKVEGVGAYIYEKQISAAIMIGTGNKNWNVWAHELGHVLGLPDIYAQATHDAQFDRTYDYVRVWGLMDNQGGSAHVVGHHKNRKGWLGQVADLGTPAAGDLDKYKFTLVPIEYEPGDYAGAATPAGYPLKHLLRLKLSDDHWVLVENRQAGPAYSQKLPDLNGAYLPVAAQRGGIFVTDTCETWSPCLYRSSVTTLNPHGTNIAKGLQVGDTFDLGGPSVYPRYDGSVIRVVGAVPGPGGRPDALQVEVDRGVGDFVDLEIRPWHAPDEYATHDIWIDWPDDDLDLYPSADPPLGNGDPTHWHPDGSVLNYVRVRVTNLGNVKATGVKVRAFHNEAGMGDQGDYTELGASPSPPQDIPAKGFRDYAFEWRPKAPGHNCIRAEILSHTTSAGELNLANNIARENITDFHSTQGSPFEPVNFSFLVKNDYDVTIEMDLFPTGLTPGMDLELETAYLVLGPREERRVKARLTLDENQINEDKRERRYFSIHALRIVGDSWNPYGGITANVYPTVPSALELRSEKLEGKRGTQGSETYVAGLLIGTRNGNEQIDAALVASDGKTYGGSAMTSPTGVFQLTVKGAPPGPGKLMLYYFGPKMAPSWLGPVPVDVE